MYYLSPVSGEAQRGGEYYTSAVVQGEPPGYWGGRAAGRLGFEPGQKVENEPYLKLLNERRAPDGAKLGRKPSGGAKAHEVYEQLVAAEPHADGSRRRELRVLAQQQVRQSPLYFDLTISPSKSISIFLASLGENARVARERGDASAEAFWAGEINAVHAMFRDANLLRRRRARAIERIAEELARQASAGRGAQYQAWFDYYSGRREVADSLARTDRWLTPATFDLVTHMKERAAAEAALREAERAIQAAESAALVPYRLQISSHGYQKTTVLKRGRPGPEDEGDLRLFPPVVAEELGEERKLSADDLKDLLVGLGWSVARSRPESHEAWSDEREEELNGWIEAIRPEFARVGA